MVPGMMTNEEIIRAAAERIVDLLDEDPVEALANIIIKDLLRQGLEDMATAHLALCA